ncbi:MAG: pyridoxamine 5'-phosphate oxidase family protein [Eubacteriales bacterium]|nr:pyridoxamine 5'-phosphate oxidase family protein [Eubacteriales bacterium]
MFREMRRKKQALTEEECRDILRQGTSGVLAVSGDDGYPYAVPLSYVPDGDKIYFHGATNGHKLDAIRRNDKVSFCVIGQDLVVPEEYTTYFRSVIVFGRARVLEEREEIDHAITMLAKRYYPEDSAEHRAEMIEREYAAMAVIELRIEHMTGKEAGELAKRRR